jgi:soluble lytic murein transglycosylase
MPRPHPERAATNDPIGDFLGAAAAILGAAEDDAEDAPSILGDRGAPEFLLESAYRRLIAGDFESATRMAAAMPDPAGARFIDWLIATEGYPEVGAARMAAASEALAGWPGQTLRQIRYEQALLREDPSPQALVDAMAGLFPAMEPTFLRLARSYRALDRDADAAELIRRIWHDNNFSTEAEEIILAEFGSFLTSDDHHRRMSRLFYDGQTDAALRVAEELSADMQRMAAAWAAVNRGQSSAASLLADVPAALRSDPSYQYAQLRRLVRAGSYSAAADLLLGAPTDPDALIDPEAWAEQRRDVARVLAQNGNSATAYAVLAGHSATDRTAVVEIEFQAGWTALRLLNDPETAIGHFETLSASSSLPLSQSRAHYWLGRCYEALGRVEEADEEYTTAAGYHTTFYGQLALARLGEAIVLDPAFTIDDGVIDRFLDNDSAQVMVWLDGFGFRDDADLLARSLADTLSDPAEIALLAQLADERGDHQLSLQIGKLAANRGLPVDAVAFPTAALPVDMESDHIELALIYAIARQESAFNTAAVSAAGAVGLLQILPSTAREMARFVGVAFAEERLIDDPVYNALLGGAYLGTLIDRYDGSYVLALAAFNAGPSRADRWIEVYGDPRNASVDAIDWIERIPFDETRNYVQRVLENLQVYRGLLGEPARTLAQDLRL